MTEDDARSNMLRCIREETAGGPKSSNSRTRNRRSAVIYPVHLQPVLNKWTSPINFAFSEDFSGRFGKNYFQSDFLNHQGLLFLKGKRMSVLGKICKSTYSNLRIINL